MDDIFDIDIEKAAALLAKQAGFSEITKKTSKRGIPHRIRWNGQIVKLRNGKNVWPTIGAAKCALTGKLDIHKLFFASVNVQPEMLYSGMKDYVRSEIRDIFYEKLLLSLQEKGILKFEPIKEE